MYACKCTDGRTAVRVCTVLAHRGQTRSKTNLPLPTLGKRATEKFSFAQRGQAPFQIILPLPIVGKHAAEKIPVCPSWAKPFLKPPYRT